MAKSTGEIAVEALQKQAEILSRDDAPLKAKRLALDAIPVLWKLMLCCAKSVPKSVWDGMEKVMVPAVTGTKENPRPKWE